MAQAGLFANPLAPATGAASSLNPLVSTPPPAATGLDALQQSLADIAAIGEQARQRVPIMAPQVAAETGPAIAYSPSTKQFYVQGQVFAEDDAQRALESEALLGQPGGALPQGGDWVPVDPQSYAGYLGRIKNPSLGTLAARNFGRGVDTMQLLAGRGLQLLGAEQTGAGIVAQQMEDLRKTTPYERTFTEIESGRDAVEWFVANLAQQGPNLLESIAVAAAGAAAGTATGGPGLGTLGGAIAGLAGKSQFKNAVLAAARKQVAGEVLDAAERKVLRSAAGIAGATAASYASNVAMGASDIYGELRDRGADPEDVNAKMTALFGSLPYAALETLPEFLLAGRVFGNVAAPRAIAAGTSLPRRGAELLRRGAVGGAIGAVGEGGTELGQEALLLGLSDQDLSKPENVERLINSFAAGAAIGGPIGAVANLKGKQPANLLNPGATEGPPLLGGPTPAPQLGGPGPVPLLSGPSTALGPAVEQVDATIYTPRTEISGLIPGQQQLMLPPPGAVLQVQGQPDFVVDEDGNVRQAMPDDVVVGISDRGYVPATAPGTQGVLDIFPGSQTTARELRGMMEAPAVAPTTLLQPEGVTGEVPASTPDLRQDVLPFESGLAPRYMAQEQAPAGTLSEDPQLRALQESLARRQMQAEQFAQVQPTIIPEATALEQRLAESQPFLDVMGTEGRLLQEPQYGVTPEEARQAWLDTKAGRTRNWNQLSDNVRNQWMDALNGNYSAADLKQIKSDLSAAESAARLTKSTPRVVVTGAITPTPVFKKEAPRAAKKPKAVKIPTKKQPGTGRATLTRPVGAATPAPTGKQQAKPEGKAKAAPIPQQQGEAVQNVKADPQYKPTITAVDKAVKDGIITNRDRIKLLVDLNKDGDFELVMDILKQKRDAAAKKATPKPTAKPAPKAAALKKGKPAPTYESVREDIQESADADVISQEQYDLLIRAVEAKTTTPDRIKAQLAYLEKGGTIKKVEAGEAFGLREKEREVVREGGPAEVAEDLTATDADYREMNVQANEALSEKKIKPLQFRELQDMIFKRRPLPAIKKALKSYRDMIMERIGDVAGGGITVAEAEAAINRATGSWKTGTKTKVWENFDAVPADLRMQLSGPTVLGFYDSVTNTVHIIADNHLSGAEAVATVYHEILGHRGLRDRFGKRALSILNAIYRTNKEVRTSADQYLKKTGKWSGNPDRFAYAVEEVLAMASESGRFQASLWQRLVNLVREFGRRVGFNIAYNNADVATILAMAHDSVIEGTGRVKGLMRAATDSPLMERQARVDELVDGLPSSLQNPVRTVTDTFVGSGVRTVARFGLMNQLIDLAVSKGIRAARRFARLSRERGAIIERQQEAFVKWAEDHAALPAQYRGVGAGTVNGLIEAMTRQEVWAFQPDYFVGEDRGTKIKLDPDLVEWYDSMPAAAQKSVREAFRLNYNSLKQMQEAVVEATNTEYDILIKTSPDPVERKKMEQAKADSLTQFRTLLKIEPTRPYAPLTRYGDWVVVGRSAELIDAIEAGDYKRIRTLEEDERHYFVDFADTRAEAARMQREITATYGSGPGNTEIFLKNEARDDMFGGRDMMYAFQRLNSMIEAEGLNPQLSRQLRQTATQLQLLAMATSSARKGELRRRNIASGDLDMVKAILSRGRASAHFVGAIYKNSEILDALNQMETEVKVMDGNREDRQAIFNGIMARYVDGLQGRVQNTLADTMTSFTSAWMLGFSPSYYIQQALQNMMITLPLMASRHNYADALTELRAGYGQVMQAWDGTRVTEQLDIMKVDPKYRALAMFLAESGELDVGINKEMGLITSDGDGFISNTFKRVMDRIRGLTRKIEAVNRLSAGIAMYNLELSSTRGTPPTYDREAYASYLKDFRKAHPDMSPMTERQFAAANAAMRIITDSHGNYSMENAPLFLRGTLGRVIGQFQKFRIMLAGLYVREFYNAFRDPSLSAEEKRVARRALMFLSGHAAIVGGLIGSPAAAIFILVYNMLTGDDEERGDLERDIREAVGNDTLANLLLRGAPTLFGVDVSGTLGQGNLLSVAPYAELPSDRDTYAKYILSLTGPAIGGIGANAADAAALLGDGNYYKALEKLMPRGIGAASKSLREATTGETTMRGDTLTQPIDLGAVEALWGTLGLAPIARVNRQFARNQFYKDEKFYQDRAADIKRAYTEASKDNDTAAMNALRLEWKGLQAARRERGFKTQPVLDLIKAPREQAKREKQTVGGIPFTAGTEGRAKQIAETAGTAR